MISMPRCARRSAFAILLVSVATSLGKFNRNRTFFSLVALFLYAANYGSAQIGQFDGTLKPIATGYYQPFGVATDQYGNLFVADADTFTISEILAVNGVIPANPTIRILYRDNYNPTKITVDRNGNVFFTDYNDISNNGNGPVQSIKELVAVNGSIPASPTLLQLASGIFRDPEGLTVDPNGNIFVADGYGGVSELLAVEGSVPTSPTIVPIGSGFDGPRGVALDASGNLFVADTSNHAIKEVLAVNGSIPASPTIVTLASNYCSPDGVSLDGNGNLFFSDYCSAGIFEILAVNGVIPASPVVKTVISGPGLGGVFDVAVDQNGHIYPGESYGDHHLAQAYPADMGPTMVGATSTVTPLEFTFIGTTTIGSVSLVSGPGTSQEFSNAGTGTCVAGGYYNSGSSYNVCTVNVIFTPNAPGERTGAVVLKDTNGNTMATGYLHGTGVAPLASFGTLTSTAVVGLLPSVSGVALDANGNLYIAATGQNKILKETLSGGTYSQSEVPTSALNAPSGVAVDGAGNIYIVDTGNKRVLEESPTASGFKETTVSSTIPPEGVTADQDGHLDIVYSDVFTGYQIDGYEGTGLSSASGIAVDADHNIYIVSSSAPGEIVKETLTGYNYTASTIALPSAFAPNGIAFDAFGNLYVSGSGVAGIQIIKLTPSAGGYVQSTISAPTISQPAGLAIDSSGNILVADSGNGQIVKIYPSGQSSLSFVDTPIGSTSVDSPQAILLTNRGNADLTFPIPATGTNPSVAANFTFSQSTPGACLVTGSGFSSPGTLAAGSSCQLAVDFTPTVVGNLSGSLVLTDNNLNAPAPGYTTQTIALSGTAGNVPTITWTAPAAITYGNPLGSAQLNATASVPGTFVYSPGLGAVLPAGVDTLSVTFTPTDTVNYTVATASVPIVVNKATPAITWVGDGLMLSTSPLSGAQLDATTSVPGTFVYNPAAGTFLSPGTQTLSVTFTPTDTADYTTASASMQVIVEEETGNGVPYTTTFPFTQNPLSEYSAWRNGKTNGQKWSDCQSTPGFAFGTQTGTADYDDSVCTLNGIWGANQAVQVTVKVNSTSGAQYDEVEVHLNTNIASNSTTGYEISCSVVANDPYLQIVRWNGAYGTFTALGSKSNGCGNGTVLSAARSGNTITASINGTAVLSVTDSTYTGGSPGMGFYIQGLNGTAAAANAGFGVSAFTASDHSTATPTFSPAAGTYTSAQTVTISDTATGATIYYTTNGTTPTTGSAVYSTPIAVNSTETLEAIAVAGGTQSAVATAAYTINLPAAATPTFTPIAGTYTSAQSVTIADTTPGATIYYTTNGTTPTTGSTPYSGAISVSATETLKAIAIANGYAQSAVGTAAYTINLPAAATPAFTPAAGTYTSTQSVTIADTTPGATIYYTTNGTTPTTSSTPYSVAISVSSTETLKAIAVAGGYTQSAVGTAAYTINQPVAATPTFSPGAGTYTSAQSVSILDTTPGATIYYTTNGTTPTTGSAVYSIPINVGASETVEAIAVASGYTQSAVGTGAYTINLPAAATPTFTPIAGTYTATQSVTIADTTAGATIYYTTSGSTPTTSSTIYVAPISVSATETLKAIAVASGYTQSAVGAAAYTINQPVAATPSFTPVGGTYTSAQSVSILDSTAGATIYYTTNGSTPTTGSTIYVAPISVSATETLKAIAVASGYTQSAIGSAAYTINLPVAATPTFTPAAGTYTAAQSVAIADATPGAVIYYTTNGVTPTTSSAVYSSPIAVGTSETVEAIAVASGYVQSAVGSAVYSINIAGNGNAYSTAFAQSENPIAENGMWVNGGATGLKWSNCQTIAGMAFGTQLGASDYDDSVCALTGTWGSNQTAQGIIKVNSTSGAQYDEVELHLNTTITANSVTGYEINCSVVSGDPYLQIVRWNGAYGSFKALGSKATGCANGDVFSAARLGTTITAYKNGVAVLSVTDSTYTGGSPGMGFYIQNLNGTAAAADAGFGFSSFSATDRVAATPAFSLAAGTYTGAQSISITDATAGAKIYYTTNGTAPSTSSTLYSGPVTVSATETVEAIAVANGYGQSATASAKYTIK